MVAQENPLVVNLLLLMRVRCPNQRIQRMMRKLGSFNFTVVSFSPTVMPLVFSCV